MRKKQKRSKTTIHYVLNIYAGQQVPKKHVSSDNDYIVGRIKAHVKRRKGESYYVLTIYKKGKPIHKHKSSDSSYIIKKVNK